MLANLPNLDAATQKKLQWLLDSFPGYDIHQDNGQRQFGPPLDAPTSPGKGCEVFVGKLPRDVFEDELVPLFARIARLHKLRLMMDFSGTTRGYAFVQYHTRGDADEAARRLHRYELRRGHRIAVTRSLDNCRLYVGGLAVDQPREEVAAMLREVLRGVVKVFTYGDPHDPRRHRGFAFVEFATHREAALARRSFFPSPLGEHVSVDWAEPEVEVDEATMSQVKVLFVRNVLAHVTEVALRRAFARATRPEAIEKVKKCKDFAFVHFFSRDAAELSMAFWNGRMLDGAELHVSWAKPVTREQHSTHKMLAKMQRCQLLSGDVTRSPASHHLLLPGHPLAVPASLPVHRIMPPGASPRDLGVDPAPIVRLEDRCAKYGFRPPVFRFFVKTRPRRDDPAINACQLTLMAASGASLPFRGDGYHQTALHAQAQLCQFVLDNWNRLEAASAEGDGRMRHESPVLVTSHGQQQQGHQRPFQAEQIHGDIFHGDATFHSEQFFGHGFSVSACQYKGDESMSGYPMASSGYSLAPPGYSMAPPGYYETMFYDQFYLQQPC